LSPALNAIQLNVWRNVGDTDGDGEDEWAYATFDFKGNGAFECPGAIVGGAGATFQGTVQADSFSPFTGSHVCEVEGVEALKPGMLIASAGVMRSEVRLNEAMPPGALCTAAQHPCVLGVLADKARGLINALGEGAMLVCDAAGAIATGDLLVSSSVAGYAERVEGGAVDPRVVVGKALVAFDFDAPVPTFVPKERNPVMKTVDREELVYTETVQQKERTVESVVYNAAADRYERITEVEAYEETVREQVFDTYDLYDPVDGSVVGQHRVPRKKMVQDEEQEHDAEGNPLFETIEGEPKPITTVVYLDAAGKEVEKSEYDAAGSGAGYHRAALLPCVYYCG
jgi:hypothetical protein